jgi:hypothetical protein
MNAEKLANDHWEYVKETLIVHSAENIEIAEYHYKTAFVHGFKHGVESCGDAASGKKAAKDFFNRCIRCHEKITPGDAHRCADLPNNKD